MDFVLYQQGWFSTAQDLCMSFDTTDAQTTLVPALNEQFNLSKCPGQNSNSTRVCYQCRKPYSKEHEALCKGKQYSKISVV